MTKQEFTVLIELIQKMLKPLSQAEIAVLNQLVAKIPQEAQDGTPADTDK